MNVRSTLTAILEIASGMAVASLGLVGRAVAAIETDADKDERTIQDSDSVGVYNFRTQQLDAGTDPYGWYEDDA